MKKFVRRTLLLVAAMVLAVLALVPFAVPTAVEHVIAFRLAKLGLFPNVEMSLGYCWRNGPGVEGNLLVRLVDTPWRMSARFGASCGEWFARAELPVTPFDEVDPTVQTLLERYPIPVVSNLTFSGSIGFSAQVERTFSMPVPVWSAQAKIRDLSVQCVAQERPISLYGLSAEPRISGIARHLDIQPLYLRAPSLSVASMNYTNLFAAIRATERSLLVTEASAGFCGGKVSLFSLFLDPKSLNAGFTLFLDDIDAGEALSHCRGFRGTASGRLHGKTRLFVREGGKAIRLSNTFLYSTPGEIGKLKMTDSTVVTDNLALAGVNEATRDNVAAALTDLDYTVLRFNLTRLDGDAARLSVRLSGTATRGETSAPVDLTLNFNGELEQLVNTGLDCSARLKGNNK